MVNVLFVCIHNSARSQMAEAFLNAYGGGHFHAESAGIEAGKLNGRVVQVMKEVGIDISAHQTKCVADCVATRTVFDLVVTVCDAVNAGKCPVVPGARVEAWFFDDPSRFTGTEEEILSHIRFVRDQIATKIREFIVRNEGHHA